MFPSSMRRAAARRTLIPAVVFLGTLLASCETTQSRYVSLGQAYPPRPQDCDVSVLRDSVPQKPFQRVSRLDVHIARTHFVHASFDSALPELKKQACLSGADAIIEIQERSTGFLEDRAYHVTATGIKFTD